MPSPIETTRADFGDVDVDGVAADLVADDLGDLVGFDVHGFSECRAGPLQIPGRVRFDQLRFNRLAAAS